MKFVKKIQWFTEKGENEDDKKYSGPQKKIHENEDDIWERKIQWSAEKGKRRRHKIQW